MTDPTNGPPTWPERGSGRQGAEQAVVSLLGWMGYDPCDPGLVDTPRRVVDALTELTSGEDEPDPGEHLRTVFDPTGMTTDEMIVLRNVPFVSVCEHHLLPFSGTATLAYLPNEGAGVVGLSKLARVVEGFARRLQVQERLTSQIAEALDKHTDNRGVAVTVTAVHTCMTIRGIRKAEAEMVTSRLTGRFRDNGPTRAEFLALARR